ncbi:MAG: glycerol-3-phosphate acyltransferase [Leptolyngbyaceae cyanobacterium SL_7_1]|nr:glycerol-3-phosphate acyltransferase [Leptolyngbyaceae cyanobacterium SL_7_1]
MAIGLASSVLILVIAYLLGATPTGYWTGRVLKGIDIREHGSKSIGATNVLRTLGKAPALFVLTIDILKGVAAIVLTRWLYTLPTLQTSPPLPLDQWVPWMVTLAGVAALLGHSKSIWINFTGGKSAATGLGILLAMAWQVGLGVLLTFVVLLALFRIVSLGSIAAAIAAPVLMVVFQQPLPYTLTALLGGLYVIWLHRANIQRLLAGTEPQIGQKHREPNQTT